ncbi:hypothetical protein [Pseudomonas bubulae]|uniref:hypothetical protein n=1 Tax=Pseudomonas bubulae TaxID=2316085 RepID=UPI0010315B0A|nr:hypothetical protein [Pseudomonas bubulae]
MSDSLKLGDIVRYKLTGELETVSDEGPIAVGGVGAIGVSSRTAYKTPLSHDHVICKVFSGAELKNNRRKKTELEFVSSGNHFEFKESDKVRLASGGPLMLITRLGPKQVGGAAIGVSGSIRRVSGSVRHDLIGCKWIKGKGEMTEEFEVGTLIPAE